MEQDRLQVRTRPKMMIMITMVLKMMIMIPMILKSLFVQSFLKTAELLRIKGLTDGLPGEGGGGGEGEATRKVSPTKKEEAVPVVASLLRPSIKRPSRYEYMFTKSF